MSRESHDVPGSGFSPGRNPFHLPVENRISLRRRREWLRSQELGKGLKMGLVKGSVLGEEREGMNLISKPR